MVTMTRDTKLLELFLFLSSEQERNEGMDFLLHKLLAVSTQSFKNQHLRTLKNTLKKKYCIKGKQIANVWKGNKNGQTIFYDLEMCGMPHTFHIGEGKFLTPLLNSSLKTISSTAVSFSVTKLVFQHLCLLWEKLCWQDKAQKEESLLLNARETLGKRNQIFRSKDSFSKLYCPKRNNNGKRNDELWVLSKFPEFRWLNG